MEILQKIVAHKRLEISEAKSRRPLDELLRAVADAPPIRDFAAAIRIDKKISLIAEVKRASPSAGLIREHFDPVKIARIYEQAGARCISVLTDEHFFRGHLDYLYDIRTVVEIPLLRKDFVLDEYQVYEARTAGADAVLLIAECLGADELRRLYDCVVGLGMTALVEFYDHVNLSAVLGCKPVLVGVNNRDLRTFQVDLGHTVEMRKLVPAEVLLVGESGITCRADATRLEAAGVEAMLVGESLMRQPCIESAVRTLLGLN